MRFFGSIVALLLAGSAGAAAPLAPLPDPPPYQRPANPADPAAQLREMLALYDSICLRAFPDNRAVAREMSGRAAPPLSALQLRRYLHEDSGVGWRIVGRTADFDVTIEAPPFHACGIRTLAVTAFPDMAPYRALADRFESGQGYHAIERFDRVVGNVRSIGVGETRDIGAGGAESLFVFTSTPVPEAREPGRDATEIRLVHQFALPSPPGA